jgi:hypothetical protein
MESRPVDCLTLYLEADERESFWREIDPIVASYSRAREAV